MACLTNYTVHCREKKTGRIGCFLFDIEHYRRTGEFIAIGEIYDSLAEFYAGTKPSQRQGIYIDRQNMQDKR